MRQALQYGSIWYTSSYLTNVTSVNATTIYVIVLSFCIVYCKYYIFFSKSQCSHKIISKKIKIHIFFMRNRLEYCVLYFFCDVIFFMFGIQCLH